MMTLRIVAVIPSEEVRSGSNNAGEPLRQLLRLHGKTWAEGTVLDRGREG